MTISETSVFKALKKAMPDVCGLCVSMRQADLSGWWSKKYAEHAAHIREEGFTRERVKAVVYIGRQKDGQFVVNQNLQVTLQGEVVNKYQQTSTMVPQHFAGLPVSDIETFKDIGPIRELYQILQDVLPHEVIACGD